MTITKTMIKTFRERPQRVILETYDLWDIWSERWGDMTWPTKRQWQRQKQRQTMRWGEMTWPKKTMTKTKTIKKTKTMTIEEHPQRTFLETCDLWDTDYIYDNWEQQSQHSQWPLNKEWQGQHSQFLRCFQIILQVFYEFLFQLTLMLLIYLNWKTSSCSFVCYNSVLHGNGGMGYAYSWSASQGWKG